MTKAKDNRKVVVSNAKEKAEVFKTASDARNSFKDAIENETQGVKRKAEIAYSFKVNETFKTEGFDNILAYFNNTFSDGYSAFYGTSYKQFMSLADMYEFVWCYDELLAFNSSAASALVTYCRKDAAKVIKVVTDGIIAPHDSKEYIRETLKPMFGGKATTVKEGTKKEGTKATSDAKKDNAMADAAIVGHFIKKNAQKNGDVAKAWDRLLKYIETK